MNKLERINVDKRKPIDWKVRALNYKGYLLVCIVIILFLSGIIYFIKK